MTIILSICATKGYRHVFEPYGQRSELYYIPQLSQLPAQDHPTQWAGDRAVRFCRSVRGGQPFFLMANFIHPSSAVFTADALE